MEIQPLNFKEIYYVQLIHLAHFFSWFTGNLIDFIMRLFTWHIHGSYLYYLSQANLTIYIPVRKEMEEGYYGRGNTFPFAENVIEVAAEEVKNLEFDCILFQTNKNYLQDQYEILTEQQRQLPKVYLEHDTPRGHAVNSRHIIKDPAIRLIHVTHYNQLMWNNNSQESTVIEHGVNVGDETYNGDIARGIVIINNLPSRGRSLGYDLFLEARRKVPLDLIGMGNESLDSFEVLHPQIPAFIKRYRFYFHPVRYTSLGLSLLEAMTIGLPVVGLATTELSSIITNKVNGFSDTNFSSLIKSMEMLIDDPAFARTIGESGRALAKQRFNIHRFTSDWENVFHSVTKSNISSKRKISSN
jgi:hypothetical protein